MTFEQSIWNTSPTRVLAWNQQLQWCLKCTGVTAADGVLLTHTLRTRLLSKHLASTVTLRGAGQTPSHYLCSGF